MNKKKLKIIFIGNVIMSLSFLNALNKEKKYISIVGIISKKKNRYQSDFFDFENYARDRKIPYYKTSNINNKTTFKWIKKIDPNLIFCFGFSQLIGRDLLDEFKNRIIGFHPSSLPILKGRNPIIWTIILNRKYTGTNFFYINQNADSGEIIDHSKLLIKDSMNSTEVYKKLIELGKKRIPILIKKILNNKKFKTIKNKSKLLVRKRFIGEEIVDWRMSSNFIHNLVRAMSYPYYGAFFIYKKKKYKILKTAIYNDKFKFRLKEYGRVVDVKNKNFIIKCGEGCIKILKTNPKINLKLNESIYQ